MNIDEIKNLNDQVKCNLGTSGLGGFIWSCILKVLNAIWVLIQITFFIAATIFIFWVFGSGCRGPEILLNGALKGVQFFYK